MEVSDLVSYGYFDHDADIGVMGRGATVEAAFVAAAEAMFAVMADLAAIRSQQHIQFTFEEADIELALVTWLNGLLAEARMHGLILGRFHLHKDGAQWRGEAWGELWRMGLEKGVGSQGCDADHAIRQAWCGREARSTAEMCRLEFIHTAR